MKSFIEVQFPVAQLSVESYIERDAKGTKLLSSLAKWWGAKPIVLSKALIIGIVMPANNNPEKWPDDLEIFLRLMTLDPDGMWHRKEKALSPAICWQYATENEKKELFVSEIKWKVRSSDISRLNLERKTFYSLPYPEQREYCCRVDQIDGPPPESWDKINKYFNFENPVTSLEDIIPLLSKRRFGRVISIGDAFCGSGVIPFAAAQMGLPSYAADLNPAACLLTWNAVNLIGGDEKFRKEVFNAQEKLYNEIQSWLDEMGYERSEEGWQAQAYLYCEEIKIPEWDNWSIPVVPNWIIAPKTETWVELIPDKNKKKFNFKVQYGGEGFKNANNGTKDGDSIRCPSELWEIFKKEGTHHNKPRQVSKKEIIKQFGGLRLWTKDDIAPREDDILQERLFCIRWIRSAKNGGKGEIIYREPTDHDIQNEQKIEVQLRSIFNTCQTEGWIPSWKIEPAYNTSQPIREKGWTHWHHLFTPHQLLVIGKYSEFMTDYSNNIRTALTMALAKILDMNNRLCRWEKTQGGGIGGTKTLFYNQAFNTFPNYAGRGWQALADQAQPKHIFMELHAPVALNDADARKTEYVADLWLTDPPYADAVHYEELTEFFLAWYAPHIGQAFPQWPKDSRRIETIKGADESFNRAMSESYTRLTSKMPDDGYQVIMFTHKSSDIWSDLTMIVWEAGLEIIAVWNVATETSGLGVRTGDHVQSTYNLVLKKRQAEKIGFMDQIKSQVKKSATEVIARMEKEREQVGPYNCGYGETDVLLTAQAAAAQVITRYKEISDLSGRSAVELKNGIRSVLETARQTAADQLIPAVLKKVCREDGLNPETWWKDLSPEERMYFKGLEVQFSGESRLSVYQDLSRIYGVPAYSHLMASIEPNSSRPITPNDIKAGKIVRYDELAVEDRNDWRYSVTRNVLIAIQLVMEKNDAEAGLSHLKMSTDFWGHRNDKIIPILNYFIIISSKLDNWDQVVEPIKALDIVVKNARA